MSKVGQLANMLVKSWSTNIWPTCELLTKPYLGHGLWVICFQVFGSISMYSLHQKKVYTFVELSTQNWGGPDERLRVCQFGFAASVYFLSVETVGWLEKNSYLNVRNFWLRLYIAFNNSSRSFYKSTSSLYLFCFHTTKNSVMKPGWLISL